MIKLTIGIPTYNSYDYLKESIDKVLSQIKSLDEVELLICDNASYDSTQFLADEYVKKFPDKIRYIRQQSNLGMDRNFWSVIENAQGEFVHLHADDFYTQGAVKRILDKIATHDLDIILLSNNYLNTCNGKMIQNNDPYQGDILCQPTKKSFFKYENLKTLCLSNIVLKKSKCLEITNIEKYFGCQWLHIAIITQIIKPTSSAYIFNFKEPVVTVRIGNQKWLEKDGAVEFYYKALLLFWDLKKQGYQDSVFEHIKTLFLPMVLNGHKIKFKSTYMNLIYCLKFLKFYYNMPKQYVLFCLRLLLKKHRPFFEGWENIGN